MPSQVPTRSRSGARGCPLSRSARIDIEGSWGAGPGAGAAARRASRDSDEDTGTAFSWEDLPSSYAPRHRSVSGEPSPAGVVHPAAMLLQGKRLLITGVLTPQSLAYGIAELAQAEGAEVVLTSFGRACPSPSARRGGSSPVPEVLELDVANTEHFARLTEKLKAERGPVHGVLHAVAYAPEDALGGNFLNTPWESVSTAFRVSTFSLKELAVAVAPVMTEGGSIVALDFDNSTRPGRSTTGWGCARRDEPAVRYLARDLGPKNIRVNAVAAGPLITMAAKGIPGFKQLSDTWALSAPLGWNARDRHPMVAKTVVALLSDWFPGTTAEVVHVDGGRHAIGSPPIDVMERMTSAATDDERGPKD